MSYQPVVRVFATTQTPDYDCPWQAQPPMRSTGSGVVITGGKILTGAHVVANATFLQVQKPSDPTKIVARVEAVCHDSDLALLALADPAGLPAFLDDVPPAEVGVLPDLRDKVSVMGFPVGGEEISITEGVVSRIEVQRYHHSQRNLLAVTVDAAINEGNSGGPVFKDGKVAGIAFQKLTSADNIGEMVPAPIIRTFLDAVAAGKPPRIPGLGVAVQQMENPLLRRQLGLADGQSGVLVVEVEHGGSGWGVLQPRDVLLAIDGLTVASNATVRYANRYRTRYDVVLGLHHVGDTLSLDILRAGRPMTVALTLGPAECLVPRSRYDEQPTYFIYGGLVFQPLTRDFLATWGKWWNKAPKELLHYYYSGMRTEERQEVVILSQILGDEINAGYDEMADQAVVAVNGVMPRNMLDFVTRLDQASGVVELRLSQSNVIMLDAAEVRAAHARILDRYHVPRDRSRELPAFMST